MHLRQKERLYPSFAVGQQADGIATQKSQFLATCHTAITSESQAKLTKPKLTSWKSESLKP